MNLCIFIRTIAASVWQLSAGQGEPAAPRQPASNKQSQEEAVERRLKLPLAAFRGKATRNFIQGRIPARFQQVEKQIWKTLEALGSAASIWELRRRRELRVEKLQHAKWQYSVRINDQYRICFDWYKKFPHPTNIEITDHYDN